MATALALGLPLASFESTIRRSQVVPLWSAGCLLFDPETPPSPTRTEAVLMAHRTWIAGHQSIGGDKQQPFSLRLGQQQPVEGVTSVQRRQLGHGQHMGGLNRDLHEATIQQRAPQQRQLHLKALAPPRAALIIISQREATLKHRVCCGSSSRSLKGGPSRAGSPMAQTRRCLSSRRFTARPELGAEAGKPLEQIGDLLRGDVVEVVGHRALTRQQAQAAPEGGTASSAPMSRGDLHQRLARFADHKSFARHRLSHQPR